MKKHRNYYQIHLNKKPKRCIGPLRPSTARIIRVTITRALYTMQRLIQASQPVPKFARGCVNDGGILREIVLDPLGHPRIPMETARTYHQLNTELNQLLHAADPLEHKQRIDEITDQLRNIDKSIPRYSSSRMGGNYPWPFPGYVKGTPFHDQLRAQGLYPFSDKKIYLDPEKPITGSWIEEAGPVDPEAINQVMARRRGSNTKDPQEFD